MGFDDRFADGQAKTRAAVAFAAKQPLEIVELGVGPWVKVRHSDGQTGFVRANQVWGL